MIEALSQREIVHRIDGVKDFGGARGLIALQMADQVPGRLQILQCITLPFPLLHAIFAEVAKPGFVGFANGFSGMRFGDGDEGDFTAIRRFLAGPRNLFLYALNIFADSGWHGGE